MNIGLNIDLAVEVIRKKKEKKSYKNVFDWIGFLS